MMRVNKWITARKAAESFLKYSVAVGAALSTVELPEGEVTDAALISLGFGAVSAVVRAVNNVRKTKQAPVMFRANSYRGLLVLAGLAVGLAGCATTTAADGTRTTTIDGQALVGAVDTAFATWDRLEARKAFLEAEKARAEAARDRERVAIVERELARMAPELERAAEAVGIRIDGLD